MCAAIRSACRGEKIGSESEKRTSAGFSQCASCSRTAWCAGRSGWSGEIGTRSGKARMPAFDSGHRPGCAVGSLDLVAHRLHGGDLDELARDHVGAEAAQPVAEAQPLLRGRPPAADAGVHDHEPADPVRVLDGEAEADRAAPVLDDDGRVAQVELLDEPRDRRRCGSRRSSPRSGAACRSGRSRSSRARSPGRTASARG